MDVRAVPFVVPTRAEGLGCPPSVCSLSGPMWCKWHVHHYVACCSAKMSGSVVVPLSPVGVRAVANPHPSVALFFSVSFVPVLRACRSCPGAVNLSEEDTTDN